VSFIEELKRRNVFRVGAAYVIVAWLIMQVADTFAPALLLPDWVLTVVAFLLLLGFPLALLLAWAFELTPEGIKKEKDVDRSDSTTHFTGRKLDFLIIGLLAVGLAYFIWEARFSSTSDDEIDSPVSSGKVTEIAESDPDNEAGKSGISASPGKSIAVLPFVNMSADPEQEYFSDGISEELLNVLAQFPGLQVAARTSAFQFKNQNRDIAEIARQLNVNHILEGSVRKSGNRLRITAQLIESDSGFHLWSESYDREMNDIFEIQDEISAAIGEALKIELALVEGASSPDLPSIPAAASAQAYEYYLKGRQLINGRSRHGLQEAVIALERALELDESYAPAHAQLAIAITLQKEGGGSYGDLSMEEVLRRAEPHVERAFELNPKLAEAYGAQALLALNNSDYSTTFKFSEKAIELNPSYMDVINWRYLALLNTGQWTEAWEVIEHMISVDPLSIVARVNYAYAFARKGQFDEAESVAVDLGRQSSRASFVARALVAGDYRGALADSSKWYLKTLASDPDDSFTRSRLAVNFAAIGEYDEARRLAPESHWMVNAMEQRWSESIEQARQRVLANLRDNLATMRLADVLHVSGDLAAAQEYYERLLLAYDGYLIIDWFNTSAIPTARAAYGRLAAGDDEGAAELIGLLTREMNLREQAGVRDNYMFITAAMVAAMDGNGEQVIANLQTAIETGLRHRIILHEPTLAAYRNDPEFQRLAALLDAMVAEEHNKTLQLICFDNPAPNVWQPLAKTCADVEKLR
jgi:TolB-like protein